MPTKPNKIDRRNFWRVLIAAEAVLWGMFAALRVAGIFDFRMKYVPLTALVLLLFDLALLLVQYDRAHKAEEAYLRDRRVFFVLGLVTLVASIPLFTDYVLDGNDIQFHLFRMEGVVQGLMDGQFPVRIHPGTLYGYGYAASSFYPEALLYVPAALRLCGFSIMGAYKTFLFLLNALTAYVAYFSFSRMFDSVKVGVVGSGLYTLSLYRLINLYTRAAVGEASAMAFLPLVGYGLFVILTADTDAPRYRFAFLPLLVGMTGLVATHLLTCEMVLPLLMLICLVCCKRTFAPKRLLAIVKAAVGTALLALCFLVPMLDYMGFDNYLVFAYSVTNRAHEALSIAQLFPLLPNGMGESLAAAEGIASEMPLGVGFVFALVLAAYPALCARIKRPSSPGAERTLFHAGWLCYGFGALLLWMTTHLFPWEGVFNLGGLAAQLASMLQFPWRLLAPATVFLVIVACRCVQLLPAALPADAGMRRLAAYTLCALAVFTAVAYCDRVLQQAPALHVQFYEDLDQTRSVGDAEYLPTGGGKLSIYRDVVTPTKPTAGITVTDFDKSGTHFSVTLENASTTEGSVELPLTMYLGYEARDDAGRAFPLTKGDHARMRLTVPAQYAGTVRIRFVERPLWRAAELLSLLTAAGLAVLYLRYRKRLGEKLFALPQ